MKKLIVLVLTVACLLSLTGCGRNKYTIGITVPAGNQDDFVFSDQEICPTGKKITISCGEGLGQTEVLLDTVEDILQTGYYAKPLAPGQSVSFDTDKGTWLKVGVNVANDADTDKTVYIEITGVEVRIE